MKTRKKLGPFVLGSVLLTLASCGGDGKKSDRSIYGAVCSEISCLSSVNWKIVMQGRNFPEKSRIDINGATVIDECIPKQKFVIDRLPDPQSIYLENYYIPKVGELKIAVIDLGQCDTETSYLSDENVNFEVMNKDDSMEVFISL